MPTKVLLWEDVEALGRSGDVVQVKPGYARNYLIPQGLARPATPQTLRQQEKLKEERLKRAAEDRREAESVAKVLEGITVMTVVKVDHEGRMYGSVTVHDIVNLLQQQHGLLLEKKNVLLKHPIKETGVHSISIKLKEGVVTSFHLKVLSEEGYRLSQEEAVSAT